MDDPLKKALEKVCKKIEGLSPEEKDVLRHAMRRETQEQANIRERLEAARMFVAAMDEEADASPSDKK